jgi:2'-5' RNA ligase
MRLFTAIQLTEDARGTLVQWQDVLRRAIRCRVAWTRPENLHITLKFIGEVDDSQSLRITERLESVEISREISVVADGLVPLPPRGPTRIIAASLVEASGALEVLFARVEAALQPIGIARDGRPFRPHLTLGRVRECVRINVAQLSYPALQPASVTVAGFDLVRSTLSPTGPSYDIVRRFETPQVR